MARILVVDDNPVDRRLIAVLLQREPAWGVETAVNGREALERLAAGDIGLVVTDLQMPEMDGVTLVREVRIRYCDIPVVLVTAQGSEALALVALRAGAANFTHKSRIMVDLVPTARRVLDWSEKINSRSHPGAASPEGGRITYLLGNDISQIPCVIHSFCDRLPASARVDELRISMALDEALTNAMCHGNLEIDPGLKCCDDSSAFIKRINIRRNCQPWCARRVQVEAFFSGDEIEFRITDEGPGFRPESLPDPTDQENLTRPGGRGMFLIRTFMDEVRHNAAGNQITMMKRRTAGQT